MESLDDWVNADIVTDHLRNNGASNSKDIGLFNRTPRSQLLRLVEQAISVVVAEVQDVPELTLIDEEPQPLIMEPPIPETTKHQTEVKDRRRKKKRKVDSHSTPTVRFGDLGGLQKPIAQIRQIVLAPLLHPELYLHLNISLPRGILLHGQPGSGKTKLAQAIAGECGLPFIQISAPSVVSGMSGESEKKIREVFEEAKGLAPCIVFIDEIDAITPKRETAQREMERRIVAQLLTCLDDLAPELNDGKAVIVIGATNRPDSLDPALRRAGRFDQEISIGIPDQEARSDILRVQCSKLRLQGDFDYNLMAQLTPGYVGADLMALSTAAGVIAVKRIFGELGSQMDTSEEDILEQFLTSHPEPLSQQELEPLYITQQDFRQALQVVQPSSKREGFASVPDVTWSDIGALSTIRDELRLSIVEPIKHPHLFSQVGIGRPSGVLLWGCPGVGKTLLAKAVANESHCNFISVKGPELLNKYVGESERGVRQVFTRARASAPCVIFFDELDALCPRRGSGSDSQTSERVVNQLLTEMDGLEERKDVYIIGATNRPDILDRAILRPGRFDKLLHVQLPSPSERAEILKTLVKKTPLAQDVDLDQLAHSEECSRFSGADLGSLVREAGMQSLRQALTCHSDGSSTVDTTRSLVVTLEHFQEAFKKIVPSVSVKDLEHYAKMAQELK